MSLRLEVRSRVVIVDADPKSYEVELHGSELDSTTLKFYPNARAILRGMPRQPPEICIVNMELPDMSGLDLYQMLIDRWPGVPIYLVGDRYNPEDEIRARCSGATLYFCKPLEPGWLSAATQLVA